MKLVINIKHIVHLEENKRYITQFMKAHAHFYKYEGNIEYQYFVYFSKVYTIFNYHVKMLSIVKFVKDLFSVLKLIEIYNDNKLKTFFSSDRKTSFHFLYFSIVSNIFINNCLALSQNFSKFPFFRKYFVLIKCIILVTNLFRLEIQRQLFSNGNIYLLWKVCFD